ncbi:MAG: MarR family winged helix-turn-helix transcriptional regulator [Planctomycetes bacterium]|nr:MarR family winged helix-turn-helix transcriptional regulator [Planctomycetota bacterium]
MPAKKNTKPDPEVLAEAARVCACFNFRKASRAVTQLFDNTLHPGGLRSTQFVILVAVAVDGAARLPALARMLNVDRSTLTRNLQPLARKGLVRISDTRGERASSVKLTAKGERVLVSMIPLWEKAQKGFVERLGGRRWRAMLDDLNSVVAIVHEA